VLPVSGTSPYRLEIVSVLLPPTAIDPQAPEMDQATPLQSLCISCHPDQGHIQADLSVPDLIDHLLQVTNVTCAVFVLLGNICSWYQHVFFIYWMMNQLIKYRRQKNLNNVLDIKDKILFGVSTLLIFKNCSRKCHKNIEDPVWLFLIL
jgi:hypothetical protein